MILSESNAAGTTEESDNLESFAEVAVNLGIYSEATATSLLALEMSWNLQKEEEPF